MHDAKTFESENANRDPLTHVAGSHPLGTGLGAALGGIAAGAAVGLAAGPVGAVLGAAAGAVLGGLTGKSVAETMDPTVEPIYWREHFAGRPYVAHGASFDDYGPAYVYGIHAANQFTDRTFDDMELHLAREWNDVRGASTLEWDRASEACRDAWERARMEA